jgi:small-conductance mechanosensitive channel
MNVDSLFQDLLRILNEFKASVISFLPAGLGALLILLVGLLVAWLVRLVTIRLVSKSYRLAPTARMRAGLRDLVEGRPIARLIGGILYWLIVVLFLTAATESLGLPIVTTWLSGLGGYLPKILSAILIGIAGVIGGWLLRDLVTTTAESARILYAPVLGRMVQVILVLVSVLIALDQLGIDVSLLQGVVMVCLGAVLLAAALAFGLGARTSVSNILAAYYVGKRYKAGDRVRIDDTEGTVVRITSHAVILDTAAGEVSVPAELFSTRLSLRHRQEKP